MPTLLLVDGNAIVHRAFHALPPFTAPDGRPTGAVYGFFSTLFSAIKQFEPTHLAVAFDVAGPTFRHQAYKEYKATRIKAPQELYDQIPIIQEVLTTMAVPQFGLEGFEADDILATIVTKFLISKSKIQKKSKKNPNIKVIILTGDLDTLQLVSDRVSVCALQKGIKKSAVYDLTTVKETYGFEPRYLIEYKTLRGDPSDNIPGAPGIGEKTAASLIQKYHTVRMIYRHIDELPEKLQRTMRSHESEIEQAKKLIELRDDVPLDFSLEAARLLNYNQQKVIAEFQKLGFRSLVDRLSNLFNPKQEALL